MAITDVTAIQKHKMKFTGQITLGSLAKSGVPCTSEGESSILEDNKDKGNHMLVALLRGVKSPWKQIIGCHITGSSTCGIEMKTFVLECLNFATELGLCVVAISSDMGNNNRNLWNELNVTVNKAGIRSNKFQYKNQFVYVIADQCHLLKNLKNCLLGTNATSGYVRLPQYFKIEQNVSSDFATGFYIKKLWNKEVNGNREIRLLHHLKEEDLYPDNFRKMNAGAAIRFFSLETVAAIRTAVHLKELPEEALSTAVFIKVIYEWFQLLNSKIRKTSITKRNKNDKLEFLIRFITIIENTQFNSTGWKLLNCGLIMTTVSICDLTEVLFNHGYEFVLTRQFTQDALENVFSQVRRRAGKLPMSKDCLNVMKLISISQFVSDIKRSNYCADSDINLINYCKNLRSAGKNIVETRKLDHTYYFDQFSLKSYVLETVPLKENYEELDLKTLNLIYNIGGSTINTCPKKCCLKCESLLKNCNGDDNSNKIMEKWKIYKNFLNMGGLKEPSARVVLLLINCELIFKRFCGHIMHNDAAGIVEKILTEVKIEFCHCEHGCDLKEDVVRHYFTVHNYSVANFSSAIKKKKTTYGSATKK